MKGYFALVMGAIVGFIAAYLTSGKFEGDPGIIPSAILNNDIFYLHMHHWLYALMLVFFIFMIDINYDVLNSWRKKNLHFLLYGFLVGLIIQGLTYNDFLHIFYVKCYTACVV
jgi:hypothetical protein